MCDERFEEERRALARSPEAWQLELFNPSELSKFASDRDVSWSNGETVEKLWRLGLVRADVVMADARHEIDGMELVNGHAGDQLIYLDRRRFQAPISGLGSKLGSIGSDKSSLAPRFHRFRYYIMLRLASVFEHCGTLAQFLVYDPGMARVAECTRDRLSQWTATPEFADLVNRWNHQAEVAIALEPGTAVAILGRVRFSLSDDEDSIERKLDLNRSRTRPMIIAYGRAAIETLRSELGFRAHTLDQNTNLHTLVRLMRSDERLKIRGAFGGCIELLSMAEVVRRAAEWAFGERLPEEDEIGPATWMKGARQLIYGTDRVFDSGVDGARDFFTSIGIDRGVKVRCYVEGYTEIGALECALGGLGGVEIINLRGEFVQARGRGLAFVESLAHDIEQEVFSVVVLDGDRRDNVRAVKAAAREGRMFGRFFISEPDFETANFTLDEMVSAALELLPPFDSDVDRNLMRSGASGARSGQDFLARIGNVAGCRLSKSKEWGASLVRAAMPRLRGELATATKLKSEVFPELVDVLFRATGSGYRRSLAQVRTDPETGRLVRLESGG